MLIRHAFLCNKPIEAIKDETDKVNEMMAQLLYCNGMFNFAENAKSKNNNEELQSGMKVLVLQRASSGLKS